MGYHEDNNTTIYLSTNIVKSCAVCRKGFNAYESDIARQINHYLDHDYKLLHVGQETSHDDDGKPWHSTVAVLKRK